MIRKFYWLFMIGLLNSIQTNAQLSTLETAVQKIIQYKNISYSQTDRQKNPFTGEWITLNISAAVSNAMSDAKSLRYYIREGRGYHYIFNGTTRITLDLNNKTYVLKTGPVEEPYHTPFYWALFLASARTASPEKVRLMPDSLIGGKPNFHFRIVMKDSASSRQIHDLFLNKNTSLPVYVRQYLQGRFGKGDMISEQISVMINEYRYSNYELNGKSSKGIKDLKIPADFKPEKKVKMLAQGLSSPKWKLLDLKGRLLSNEQQKGKVTLIDFSFNACAACMLSIPVLKRLHEKYKDAQVTILTVNTSDPRQSVIDHAVKNGIKYPVLLNGIDVAKSFQVSAFPSFYLLDKNGMIAATFEGFGKDFEEKVMEKIDQLK